MAEQPISNEGQPRNIFDAFRQARARQQLRTGGALKGRVDTSDDLDREDEIQEQEGKTSLFSISDEKEKLRRYGGYFWTGPRRYLRNCRPYYWLPLEAENLDPKNKEQSRSYKEALTRILEDVKGNGQKITDVFVVSHGWHRNLYSAASAYDRLVGRFVGLMHSGRLRPKREFVPLFICLQWHSDPGQNHWLDNNGRRSKLSFLEKVREHFHIDTTSPAKEAQFLQDFEQLFEILSLLVSTPEQQSQNVPYNEMETAHALLNNYCLVGEIGGTNVKSSTLAERTVVLWMCYHESVPRRPLTNQKDHTKYGYLTPAQAISVLLSFVTAIVPLVTLVFSGLNGLKGLWAKLFKSVPPQPVAKWLFIGVIFCATYLYVASFWSDFKNTWNESRNRDKSFAYPRGFSFTLLIAFLVTEVIFAIPLLLSGFASYFFGGFSANYLWKKSLSAKGQERIGTRNEAPTQPDIDEFRSWQDRPLSRGRFASIARLPVQWLRSAVPLDGHQADIADVLDSQLAFYEMQNRGVQCGHLAGEAIQKLFDLDRANGGFLTGAKFHFIGHSFGTLVVANAVRFLAHAKNPPEPSPKLQTLCLLQAALSSNWLDEEKILLQSIQGNIANVYSRYDTANGFYYPLANYARTAAGNMGVLPVKTLNSTLQPVATPNEPLVLLVQPPNLTTNALTVQPPGSQPGMASVLNLDASRIVYEGAAALGGGHDDIFKDDVVYLIWATCGL